MNKYRLYWDTAVWTEWNRNQHGQQGLCAELLRRAEKGELEIVLSTLVLAEFAPQDSITEEVFQQYLLRSSFKLVALSRHIALKAREIVKQFNRLPGRDAVHIASALYAKADYLFTYDKKNLLSLKVPGIIICEPFIPSSSLVGQRQLVFETAATNEES